MATLDRDGMHVWYDDGGVGEPPVVLVHGLGGSGPFAALAEHLRRERRVVTPDLPGHGRSTASPQRSYGLAEHADDIAWLCDELELRSPVIVGHSMGAAIAFEVAAARPDLPSAIVLLDPIPIVPLPALHEQRAALLAAIEGPGYRDALRAFAEGRMFRPTDDPQIRARIVDDMCATPQHILVPTFASINAWSGEHVADRVKCPVLLITAGDGLPNDLARTRELITELELGRTVGTGHFAHVFAPDQVNAMIDRFLATSVAAAT